MQAESSVSRNVFRYRIYSLVVESLSRIQKEDQMAERQAMDGPSCLSWSLHYKTFLSFEIIHLRLSQEVFGGAPVLHRERLPILHNFCYERWSQPPTYIYSNGKIGVSIDPDSYFLGLAIFNARRRSSPINESKNETKINL
jgi:hypothetical protein